MFARLAAWQVLRPLPFLSGALALAAIFGALALRLTLKTQFDQLLPEDQPSVIELQRLRARIAQGSSISVVLEGDDPGALRRTSRAIVRELEEHRPPWLIEASDGIHALQEFLRPRIGLFADRLELASLRDQLQEAWNAAAMGASGLDLGLERSPPLPSLEEMSSRLSPGDPALSRLGERHPDGYYQRTDGRALVVLVRTSIPPGQLEAARAAQEHVRAAVARARGKLAPLAVRVGLAGDLVTGLSEYSAVLSDLMGVGLLGLSMVLAVVMLFFMRVRALAALGLTIAVGLALTFGTAQLLIGHLNVATAFLISIVAGNGINSGIIYTARYLEARRSGAGVAGAVRIASTATWLPTFGAAVAAAAAYGSLGLTSFLGLKHFAVIGGAGMLLCWAATYAVTPPLLVLSEHLRPLRFDPPGELHGLRALRRMGLQLGDPFVALISRAPVAITALGAIVTVGSASLALQYLREDRMEYDTRKIQNDLRSATELYRVSALAREILGVHLESSMVVLADRIDQVLPLKRALEARRDSAPAKARPFEAVHTLCDLVAPDQEAKLPLLQDIASVLRKAHARGLVSAGDWERIAPILPPPGLKPYGLADLPEQVARPFSEKDGVRGRVLFIEPTAGQDDSDLHYLLRWTDAFRETALPSGEKIRGSGRAVVFADMLQSIMTDMPAVLSASLLLTLMAVVVTFRRGRLSLLVLGALLTGVIWLLALLQVLHVKINFINFVALPVTFGIGVDYALNVVQRHGTGEGVRSAIRNAGAAVALCSLTTILSYLALLGSINQAVRSLGLVAVLGELCCLTVAVLVLPAALLLRERRASRAGTCPAPGLDSP